MESEGPYFHRCGTPGEKSNCKACAYEEGWEAAEKDFKELLDLAKQAGNFNQDMMQWKIKFEDWKKARGIE